MQYINLKDKYNFIQPTQDFLERNSIWRVTLSDGDNIVMDYKENPGSWERLYNYCKESKLYIKSMWIGFRDNVILYQQIKMDIIFVEELEGLGV